MLAFRHICFPVNIAKFLRAAFLKNISCSCFGIYRRWSGVVVNSLSNKDPNNMYKVRLESVIRHFTIFTRKNLCWSLYLTNNENPTQLFAVNIAKLLRVTKKYLSTTAFIPPPKLENKNLSVQKSSVLTLNETEQSRYLNKILE